MEVDDAGPETEKIGKNGTKPYWVLFVGGLNRYITEKDILNATKPHAKIHSDIISIRIIKKPKTKKGDDNLGFINFRDKEAAMRAYEGLKDSQIKGKKPLP